MNPLCVMYGLCIICVLRRVLCFCCVFCAFCVVYGVFLHFFWAGVFSFFFLFWFDFFFFLSFLVFLGTWHELDLASWILDGLGLKDIYPGIILYAISSMWSLYWHLLYLCPLCLVFMLSIGVQYPYRVHAGSISRWLALVIQKMKKIFHSLAFFYESYILRVFNHSSHTVKCTPLIAPY